MAPRRKKQQPDPNVIDVQIREIADNGEDAIVIRNDDNFYLANVSSDAIKEAIERGKGSMYRAAKILGVSVGKLHSRVERDAELSAYAAEQREQIFYEAEERFLSALEAEEKWAIIAVVNKRGSRFGYTETGKADNNGGVTLIFQPHDQATININPNNPLIGKS